MKKGLWWITSLRTSNSIMFSGTNERICCIPADLLNEVFERNGITKKLSLEMLAKIYHCLKSVLKLLG